jgi:hypothetical protein
LCGDDSSLAFAALRRERHFVVEGGERKEARRGAAGGGGGAAAEAPEGYDDEDEEEDADDASFCLFLSPSFLCNSSTFSLKLFVVFVLKERDPPLPPFALPLNC